jgi:hypothetical protein
LDDVLVFGKTQAQFVENLRLVFLRFRERRITVNPRKTKLGLSSVEYVGHTFSEEGVTFSREKLGKVLDFPVPEDMKSMKSFLGLINYFRDHVSNMSSKVKPLQDMVKNYDRRKKLKWTPELIECFERVQKEISECPTLFFLVDDAQIIVETDASDYGMGAYV